MKNLKLKLLSFSIFSLFLASCDNEIKKDDEFKLPSNLINKITIDRNGVKWIATSKGLASYDGVKWTAYSENVFLNNRSIYDLAFENDSIENKIWIASNVGATSLTAKNNTITSYNNYNSVTDSILDDRVLAVNIGLDNVKYIGTSKGLSIFKGNTWTSFLGRKKEEILTEYEISSIASAKDGWVYAATKGGGVSRFKYTDAVTGATTFDQPWAYGLKSDTVFTVFVDENSNQWFGTNRGLAFHESPNTKSGWTSYSRLDGLICDTVYAINKDHSGKIWIGTEKGISTLDGDVWQKFTTNDGLVDNKVNTIAVDQDGSIWFGTENGISLYSNGIWKNFQ
jgi:ligand-binding sensor domain-containing protein